MSWDLRTVDEVVVVTMTSNPVNILNPAFFADLNNTFDEIDRDYAKRPVVLTGTGHTFSAGIDFEHSFGLFERGEAAEIRAWYADFRDSILRVFTHPTLTVAALNGHAFAGGLILALSCDVRIASPQATRFALNEVPIGIPMPMAYNEVISFRVGAPTATDAILSGREYDLDAADQNGFINTRSGADDLLDMAIARAKAQHPDTAAAYAHTKALLQRPVLDRIERLADDDQTIAVISSPESVRVQKQALSALKKR